MFLGMGLGGVNKLGLAGDGVLAGVMDAVDWIANLRQAKDLSTVPVGRRVVVIGGGMTAIDAAVQSKRLGAEEVTVVYRRGEDAMKASLYERQLAQTNGVLIRTWAMPSALHGDDGRVSAVAFERTAETGGRLSGTGETFTIPADMVLVAIGQVLVPSDLGGADVLALSGGRIVVDGDRRTSIPASGPAATALRAGRISLSQPSRTESRRPFRSIAPSRA